MAPRDMQDYGYLNPPAWLKWYGNCTICKERGYSTQYRYEW
jgi:hypothetical protein